MTQEPPAPRRRKIRSGRPVNEKSPIAGLMTPPTARGSRNSGAMSELERVMTDARARAKSGDWDGARAPTFVGLYAVCHEMVYQVPPGELDVTMEFRGAARAALGLLNDVFQGDGAQFAHFVKWSWTREKNRATWAASKNFDRKRMGWRMQFSASLVTDYRIEAKRHR